MQKMEQRENIFSKLLSGEIKEEALLKFLKIAKEQITNIDVNEVSLENLNSISSKFDSVLEFVNKMKPLEKILKTDEISNATTMIKEAQEALSKINENLSQDEKEDILKNIKTIIPKLKILLLGIIDIGEKSIPNTKGNIVSILGNATTNPDTITTITTTLENLASTVTTNISNIVENIEKQPDKVDSIVKEFTPKLEKLVNKVIYPLEPKLAEQIQTSLSETIEKINTTVTVSKEIIKDITPEEKEKLQNAASTIGKQIENITKKLIEKIKEESEKQKKSSSEESASANAEAESSQPREAKIVPGKVIDVTYGTPLDTTRIVPGKVIEQNNDNIENLTDAIKTVKKIKYKDLTSLGMMIYVGILLILYVFYGYYSFNKYWIILRDLILDFPTMFTLPPTPAPQCIEPK